VKYLVPLGLLGFQRETLHLLGLRDEQLIPFPGDAVWECERLWFASLPPSGAEIPDAVEWLRQQFFSATSVSRTAPERRFYLSRDGAKHARVVNEDQLTPVLEKYKFEILQPHRLSVVDQVRLFAQAQAIVSPTSSGQANMLFAAKESRNLEILEPHWAAEKAYVVWTLAETLGQPFSYLVAESVANSQHPSRADLYLSPTKLDFALEQFVGLQRP